MGLVATGLDQRTWVQQFNTEILKALQVAKERVNNGTAKDALSRWFGTSVTSTSDIASLLVGMRSNFNIQSITLGFTPLRERDGNQNATAPQRSAVLAKPLADPGTGRSHIELDLNFKRLPQYLPKTNGIVDATAYHQSQFETLVHELTHLLLNKEDISGGYGTQNALVLAKNRSSEALKNAENWGIFIEACGRNKSS